VDRQAWANTGALPLLAAGAEETYIAATGGNEQARTFLHIDLGGTGAEPIDQSAVLRLVESPDSILTDQAGISACLLTAPIVGSGQISPADAPAADCSARVDGTRDGSGHWSFELGVFLQSWSSGTNNGLALLPDLAVGTDSFRAGFDMSKTVVISAGAAVSRPPSPVATPDATPGTPAETPGSVASVGQVGSPPQHGTAEEPPRAATPVVAPEPSAPQPLPPVARGAVASAATPSSAAILALVLIIVLAAAGLKGWVAQHKALAPARVLSSDDRAADVTQAMQFFLRACLLLGLLSLPMFASDPTTFKLGLVLITVVAAIGLHILVNWSGEFSLAHAGFIGLPALVAARLSADVGFSPIYALPVAIVIGATLGGVVALPAMRARGLQVALVTLAAGVAIDRFFFTKSWLVGSTGVASVPTPTLGPLTLDSSRSLYPVLAIVVALSALAAAMLYRSKLARSFLWMKENAPAASAFGVPVRRYRIAAFAVAGAYAGLAGGLSVMWIQRVSPTSFPLAESINYLLFAVLAGPGFIWGVVLAAGFFEAGRLFIKSAGWIFVYGGPLGLVINVVRYPQGINGMIRSFSNRMRGVVAMIGRPESPSVLSSSSNALATPRAASNILRFGGEFLPIIGAACLAAGFTCIGLAWYHAGNTDQLWIQNQELISGGVGGLALVLTGLGLLIRDRLRKNNDVLIQELRRALGELRSNSATGSFHEDGVPVVAPRAPRRAGTSTKAGI